MHFHARAAAIIGGPRAHNVCWRSGGVAEIDQRSESGMACKAKRFSSSVATHRCRVVGVTRTYVEQTHVHVCVCVSKELCAFWVNILNHGARTSVLLLNYHCASCAEWED